MERIRQTIQRITGSQFESKRQNLVEDLRKQCSDVSRQFPRYRNALDVLDYEIASDPHPERQNYQERIDTIRAMAKRLSI